MDAGVGDRHARAPRLLASFSSAATRLLSHDRRPVHPVAPRIDTLAAHAYCLPVVRELPQPAADPRRQPQLVTTAPRQS